MADRARNALGLGKAVTFNVVTPMTRFGTWVVRLLLWYFDRVKSSQDTAKALSFLPFVHWVVIERNKFPRLSNDQPREQLHYDYLFFSVRLMGRGARTSMRSPMCFTSHSIQSGSGALLIRLLVR